MITRLMKCNKCGTKWRQKRQETPEEQIEDVNVQRNTTDSLENAKKEVI